MKEVLSIEQMKHLKELGLDTSDASMVLIATDDDGCKYNPNNITQHSECFSRFKVCIGKKVMYFD